MLTELWINRICITGVVRTSNFSSKSFMTRGLSPYWLRQTILGFWVSTLVNNEQIKQWPLLECFEKSYDFFLPARRGGGKKKNRYYQQDGSLFTTVLQPGPFSMNNYWGDGSVEEDLLNGHLVLQTLLSVISCFGESWKTVSTRVFQEKTELIAYI